MFSSFRLGALRARLAEALPGVELGEIDAVYAYFVGQSTDALTPEEEAHLHALLGDAAEWTREDGFLVTPRKGTISPWSSKASDIFRNCGLEAVTRVERGIHFRITDAAGAVLDAGALEAAWPILHDRMTEGVYTEVDDLFETGAPAPLRTVTLGNDGSGVLRAANRDWGLALSDDEIDYLAAAYARLGRDPSDVELFMFSQVNSEHCRHKIFNAEWVIDGEPRGETLFGMIRNTHRLHPEGCLVAYSDNSGVLEGVPGEWFEAQRGSEGLYAFADGVVDLLCKVETHNQPTAISPFAGAATGVGGEIRDEGATGIGGRPKAGMSAFFVSHLQLPGTSLPWETAAAGRPHPSRLATPLQIMLEAPIGGAAFGNEFGRPQLTGVFRTYEETVDGRLRGYHKPIMAAGGMGNLKRQHVAKHPIAPGSLILQIGGPAMRIGLGGGAASSISAGANSEALDFDSVQRGNPEMQRRCQEVIDTCISLGEANPILSIHDIGAGGLSNGCPELIAETGGHFELRSIDNLDPSMSPMEIWCCEAQERYVLAITPADLERFSAICERERCPFAVLGNASPDGQLRLTDRHFGNNAIDLPMDVLLGKPPRMTRTVEHRPNRGGDLAPDESIDLNEAIQRVLRFPAVASKSFLITIADRSITGMVARDQMVGPWQTPVADCAITTTTLRSTDGEAMAVGERSPLAVLDPAASARMAIGELFTNLAGAAIGEPGRVKLSANWMAACGEPGEDAALFDAVRTVGLELCPALGVAIPVGKDSLSMRTRWSGPDATDYQQSAPMTLLVTGFSPVTDVRKTVTPDLKPGPSVLLLLTAGDAARLGGSALAQVFNTPGGTPPDLNDPAQFRSLFAAAQALVAEERILACHDRSDGGLFTTVAEMAFAGRRGVDLHLDKLAHSTVAALFNEELGLVIQVAKEQLAAVMETLARHGMSRHAHLIGAPTETEHIRVTRGGEPLADHSLYALQSTWGETSYRMQALRDHPECAAEAHRLLAAPIPPMPVAPTFDPDAAPAIVGTARPRIAVLREQGINGHIEMGAAFTEAGFDAYDVHMSDLLAGRKNLADFEALVACGGFSYGDVLGAGSGWARSILYQPRLRDQFAAFFARPGTLSLGVCNGCQMLSQLKGIIPGADAWPRFVRNRSEQFEARYAAVEILPSPSLFFRGMEGSRLPIPVAHGEGRVAFEQPGDATAALACVRYIDHAGAPTGYYPLNPNGSADGLTGLTTTDGRATILMPHPERCFRSVQMSWRPKDHFTGEAGPWLRMFQNARAALQS